MRLELYTLYDQPVYNNFGNLLCKLLPRVKKANSRIIQQALHSQFFSALHFTNESVNGGRPTSETCEYLHEARKTAPFSLSYYVIQLFIHSFIYLYVYRF